MIYKIYKTHLGKRHIMHTYEQLHVKLTGCYTSGSQKYSGKARYMYMIICWNAPFYHIHRSVDV